MSDFNIVLSSWLKILLSNGGQLSKIENSLDSSSSWMTKIELPCVYYACLVHYTHLSKYSFCSERIM